MHAPPPRAPGGDLRRQALQKRALDASQGETHTLGSVLEDAVQDGVSLAEQQGQASSSRADDVTDLPAWGQYWHSQSFVDVPGR